MAAVPATSRQILTVQDGFGYTSVVELRGFIADISTNAATLAAYYNTAATFNTAVSAATNGKVVLQTITLSFNRAQPPAISAAQYPSVLQRATLNYGDGATERTHTHIPAPVSSILIPGTTIVDRTSALVAAISAIYAGNSAPSGLLWNEFLGGQLVSAKARRRRVTNVSA